MVNPTITHSGYFNIPYLPVAFEEHWPPSVKQYPCFLTHISKNGESSWPPTVGCLALACVIDALELALVHSKHSVLQNSDDHDPQPQVCEASGGSCFVTWWTWVPLLGVIPPCFNSGKKINKLESSCFSETEGPVEVSSPNARVELVEICKGKSCSFWYEQNLQEAWNSFFGYRWILHCIRFFSPLALFASYMRAHKVFKNWFSEFLIINTNREARHGAVKNTKQLNMS